MKIRILWILYFDHAFHIQKSLQNGNVILLLSFIGLKINFLKTELYNDEMKDWYV